MEEHTNNNKNTLKDGVSDNKENEVPKIEEDPTDLDIIFNYLDESNTESAVDFIKTHLKKMDLDFIENLSTGLSIIANRDPIVIKGIISDLLAVLNVDDDIIRYSILGSLKAVIEENPELITPYIADFLKYNPPERQEGMLILMKGISEKDPDVLKEFTDIIISLLSEPEEYIRNHAIKILQDIGKKYSNETEEKIMKYLKENKEKTEIREKEQGILEKKILEIQEKENHNVALETGEFALKKATVSAIRKNCEEMADEKEIRYSVDKILKEISSISSLEEVEMDKREQEVEQKLLKEKVEEVEKMKLQLKKETLEMELENIEKESELKKKEITLKQVELELKEKELSNKETEILIREKQIIEKKAKLQEEDHSNDKYEPIDL